jgi:alkyldihydroxyacetonephosphate synthase
MARAPQAPLSTASADDRRWWGWGDRRKKFPLPETAAAGLFAELGLAPRQANTAEPALPQLPASAFEVSANLAASLPAPPCSLETGFADRLRCATGRSTPDLLRLRFQRIDLAPDGVALPENEQQLVQLIAWAQKQSVAVVPFGGGTSVVGGVTPLRGRHRAVVAVDMQRMNQLLSLDPESGLARAQAGILGPNLEQQLQQQGWSLGHFPQSFEYSTLGGWLATRSAGQNSTLYGKIEHMAAAVRMIAPTGEVQSQPLPACATGPELQQLMVGSEGVLGVLSEGTMRVHRLPQETQYRSFFFPDFTSGFAAARQIMHDGLRPAVFRLSDQTETRLLMKLGGADQSKGVKFLRLLGKGRFLDGCHFMLGFEGEPKLVQAQVSACVAIAKRCGGLGIGSGPGKRWEKERFELPYFRDTLLDHGVVVETFETAAPWAQLPALHQALQELPVPLVLAHISHAYTDGASLYITWLADAPDPDQALELWQQVKDAAAEIIVRHGATISHHHAVGTDHVKWLKHERGSGQMQILRSLKQNLDPHGIMNPGKLIADD